MDNRTAADLTPLPYHANVVAYLRSREPEVWRWASSLSVLDQHAQDVRAHLLRETYRLTPEAHASPYAICARAMERLGIAAPATLYQTGDGAMNAALCFLPGEVHIVLQGPVLERLSESELLALFGHELAHFKLWSDDGGVYHTADRILDHTLADPGASASHFETARLYRLHTEIYADRGGAIAAQDALPAISTLVKVYTGLTSVDPASYLDQSVELEQRDPSPSQGTSHPESYVRARGLEQWWSGASDCDTWLHTRLRGPIEMERLDLTDQVYLEALTRRFFARFLGTAALRSDRILTQARAYFPDWSDQIEPVALEELRSERVGDSVRDYLHFVMLDLALSDDDLRDEALLEAGKLAHALGSHERFAAALRNEVGMAKRDADKLMSLAAKRGSP